MTKCPARRITLYIIMLIIHGEVKSFVVSCFLLLPVVATVVAEGAFVHHFVLAFLLGGGICCC